MVLLIRWANVDGLIARANSDTLKCILNTGEVIYLKAYNPANDNGW